MRRRPHSFGARQRGLTLIVVMLILAVVMILGVGGAQIALLGERSTRYDRDYLVASQAAEAALMDAEYDIGINGPTAATTISTTRSALFTQTNTMLFQPGCGSSGNSLGLCTAALPGTKPVWATVDFLATSQPTYVSFGAFTGRSYQNALQNGGGGIQPALPPRYVIEVVPDKGNGNNAGAVGGQQVAWMYRITAIGFGPRQEVQVVMQISYRK
jgi:type IV pilus assembly protein PilX